MQIVDNSNLFGFNDDHIHYLSDRHGIHHHALSAWQAMQKAAKVDGFNLTLASSFRSFDRQNVIWNKKFSGKLTVYDINEQIVNLSFLCDIEKVNAIMLFSALPGASRHHWGTDIDVYDPNYLPNNERLQLTTYEYQQNGPMYPLYLWLKEHAQAFDFFFPYDVYRGGISAEPWHLSYAPISSNYQTQLTEQKLCECISAHNILGKQIIIDNISELFTRFILNIGTYSNE